MNVNTSITINESDSYSDEYTEDNLSIEDLEKEPPPKKINLTKKEFNDIISLRLKNLEVLLQHDLINPVDYVRTKKRLLNHSFN